MSVKDYQDLIYKSNIPALRLNLDVPCFDIYEELKAIKETAVPQIGNESWKGFALRGIASNKPRPYYEYGYETEREAPYKWTEIAERCPKTKKFINGFFGEGNLCRVKVNILEPNGKIHLHTDGYSNALGVSDKTTDPDVISLTVAVYWPKEVVFNLDGLRIPIETSTSWLLNYSKPHRVYNPTVHDRYYLSIAGYFSELVFFRELVLDSYEKYSGSVFEIEKEF